MNKKIAVGILGCTGAVGQKLIALLADHPWFEVIELAASKNSANKVYGNHVNWKEPSPLPKKIGKLKIKSSNQAMRAKILFSGLDSSVAGKIENFYAKRGHIILSNAKNHRMDKKVPLVIPEINNDHFKLIKKLDSRLRGNDEAKLDSRLRGNDEVRLDRRLRENDEVKLDSCLRGNDNGAIGDNNGAIITNPNCSVIVLATSLYPIFEKFGLKNVVVNTMQAISGTGYPGIPAMDILGNVIPNIKDEEEKIQTEILKIFGNYKKGKVNFADFKISASCNRVPVYDGHTLSISFATIKKATKKEIINAFKKLNPLDLPSSPKEIIKYFADPMRPQPLLDVDTGGGMTVSIGNLRPCNVLDWKFTALGHNTIRGAAGAAILNAEHIVKNYNLCSS